jgi:hypothetical protein
MRVDRGIDRGGKQLSPRCPRGAAATKFLGQELFAGRVSIFPESTPGHKGWLADGDDLA